MPVFRRLSAFSALLTWAISTYAYPISPVPGDLVVNGGFEDRFTGWSFTIGASPSLNVANAYSGMAYEQFHTTGTNTAIINQVITTTPSTTYILTFYLKTSGIASPNNFDFKMNNGPSLFSVTNDVTHGYQFHTLTFITPASGATATSNTIGFSAKANTGNFWLDDVSIVTIPVPCDNNFYQFDPATGRIKVEPGKIYPSPPQPDTSFPVINGNGQLYFNYRSDSITQSSPRRIVMALAPPGLTTTFGGTPPLCQFSMTAAPGCPNPGDVAFTFSDFETLFIKNCVTRVIAPDSSSITYSADVFTLYIDPYFFQNTYSELKPFPMTMTVPYSSHAMTSSPSIDVVSDEVSVSYLPVEVINDGTPANPIVQFSTISTTFYPFVAYGDGTKYTAPPSGPPTPATDPSGTGACVLYQAPGQVAPATTYCDTHPGICTVECTRTIPIRAPVCDMSGYDWTFAFKEFVDFSLSSTATTQSTDPTWASFTEDLLFDSSPQWNVCPSATSPNYASFVTTSAIHGHFDPATGAAVLETNDPVLATTPLNFGFEISINLGATSNGVSATTVHIYKATLTEVKITGPHGDYYLVGSSVSPTVGGSGAGVPYVHGLSFNPSPLVPTVYQMSISPQTNPTDPKFAVIAVTFIPNQGDSGFNIFSNADSGSQSLTVTFAGVISLFADGSTPTKRDILFRRQVTANSNGTFADPSQVVNSLSKENSTTIVIQVPRLGKVISAATIIGAVFGGLLAMCLLAISFFVCRKQSRVQGSSKTIAVSIQKLENGTY